MLRLADTPVPVSAMFFASRTATTLQDDETEGNLTAAVATMEVTMSMAMGDVHIASAGATSMIVNAVGDSKTTTV